MDKNKNKNTSVKGRKGIMNNTSERPCTPSESVAQSIREMTLMRQGKMKKRTWDDLKKELERDK